MWLPGILHSSLLFSLGYSFLSFCLCYLPIVLFFPFPSLTQKTSQFIWRPDILSLIDNKHMKSSIVFHLFFISTEFGCTHCTQPAPSCQLLLVIKCCQESPRDTPNFGAVECTQRGSPEWVVPGLKQHGERARKSTMLLVTPFVSKPHTEPSLVSPQYPSEVFPLVRDALDNEQVSMTCEKAGI